ncbi:ADP-ribosylation factor family-domain-containing protein [Mycena rebaudengoi]|nr:ADP-ribosylation factor family-domain-containing protein [Mycena rebaudengoi]
MGATLSTAADLLAPIGPIKIFEVVMVGLDGAGKTTLLSRLKKRDLPPGVSRPTTPTIGCTMETISFRRNNITIWEFGGMDNIRPLWWRYYWHGHAFIFALDAAAPERFAEAREELDRMHSDSAASYLLLVLANKMDLPQVESLATVAEALGAERFPKWGRPVVVKGVSALYDEGMDEVLQWFVENVTHSLITKQNENIVKRQSGHISNAGARLCEAS